MPRRRMARDASVPGRGARMKRTRRDRHSLRISATKGARPGFTWRGTVVQWRVALHIGIAAPRAPPIGTGSRLGRRGRKAPPLQPSPALREREQAARAGRTTIARMSMQRAPTRALQFKCRGTFAVGPRGFAVPGVLRGSRCRTRRARTGAGRGLANSCDDGLSFLYRIEKRPLGAAGSVRRYRFDIEIILHYRANRRGLVRSRMAPAGPGSRPLITSATNWPAAFEV